LKKNKYSKLVINSVIIKMTNYFLGIDIGASTAKAVLIDDDTQGVLASSIKPSGVDFAKSAEEVREDVLNETYIPEDKIKFVVSTGYGRNNVEFANENRTEINCHARGVFYYYPESCIIVDIGGQDNKVIIIDASGKRLNFKMNRKCAAGTGTFLEEIARRLNVPLEKMDKLARRATSEIALNSFCTVFASTEILSRIRDGESVENMVGGAFNSIVQRVIELGIIGTEDKPIVLTGGVVQHNPFIVELLEKKMGVKIKVPPEPQVIGALGAAMIAEELYRKENEDKQK
jgi:predicted CoA-substrate-specific enzyme activase